MELSRQEQQKVRELYFETESKDLAVTKPLIMWYLSKIYSVRATPKHKHRIKAFLYKHTYTGIRISIIKPKLFMLMRTAAQVNQPLTRLQFSYQSLKS